MQTMLIVATALVAALALVAVGGGWWLRRAALRPVPAPALCSGGASSDCAGCPSASGALDRSPLLMAAAGKKGGGPTRRSFLRGGLGVATLGAVGGLGSASLAMLWPDLREGFGAVLDVGDEDDLLGQIDEEGGQLPYSPGRALLVRYDAEDDPEGAYAEITDDQQARIMALFQTCPHLGCTVPWCDSSDWWECPCHGSQYNRWGEWQGGPAPRGMDRFRVTVEDGRLMLDTSEVIEGPSRGAGVLDQPPEGPHCV